MVAWDLPRLLVQARKRADESGAGAVVERLARAVANAPVPAGDIATVAVAVDVGPDVEARLRVRCADHGTATLLTAALESTKVDGVELRVVRDGLRVEAVGTLPLATLLARLEAR